MWVEMMMLGSSLSAIVRFFGGRGVASEAGWPTFVEAAGEHAVSASSASAIQRLLAAITAPTPPLPQFWGRESVPCPATRWSVRGCGCPLPLDGEELGRG